VAGPGLTAKNAESAKKEGVLATDFRYVVWQVHFFFFH
jgi:hypothetical protein